MAEPAAFTPALGRPELTGSYDRVVAMMTRERWWRARLLAAMAPKGGEVIVDLGCGTGSLAVMLARACAGAQVHGVDPDPAVRAIAQAKASAAGVAVGLHAGLGGDRIAGLPYGVVDKVVSTLVLHQCPPDAKAALLANAFALLRPGGGLFIADYGVQPTLLMQILFNQVRSLDGFGNTRANKDGRIPKLIGEADFSDMVEHWVLPTPSGAITLWTARKAGR